MFVQARNDKFDSVLWCPIAVEGEVDIRMRFQVRVN